MTKPENLYKKDLSEYAARANPALEESIILQALAQAFEEGVDAGRKWGSEEWRERIQKLNMAHWPVSDYSTDPSGLVHWFVEELLSGRDIE